MRPTFALSVRWRVKRLERNWSTDDEFVAAQRELSKCSPAYRRNAAFNLIRFGSFIHTIGRSIESLVDFGGGDGYAAYKFSLKHFVRPLIVDCEPERLAEAESKYGLKTVCWFLEKLDLPNKSYRWGFCSHTLEHLRDPDMVLRQMNRVIREGCMFVIPLEE